MRKWGIVVLLLLLWGCSKPLPDPGSPLSYDSAEQDARIIAIRHGGEMGKIEDRHNGNSMGRTISKNAIHVTVRDFDGTQVGDIVVYAVNGLEIVHTVISRTPDAMRCRGDNNNHTDSEMVTRANYVGTVISQHYFRGAQ